MATQSGLPVISVAETIADQALAVAARGVPLGVRSRAEELLIDVVGLCVAARETDYMRSITRGIDSTRDFIARQEAAIRAGAKSED